MSASAASAVRAGRSGAPAGALVDGAGQPIALGARLGAGGEGAVHEVAGRPGVACKLYHLPPDAARAGKLRAMAGAATERLGRVAAWPTDVVLAGGRVAGVLLPRISRPHELHVLYGPRSRALAFPRADYRFLVHVAANVARAFAVVHDHGHVVGDVNPGVLSACGDGTVVLVDCDGFQIHARGQMYSCDVGVPEYQPPELQGEASFRGLRRVPEHDRFGLAVLVFQLLFLGRHPFSGVPLGAREEQLPIARAIALGRYPWTLRGARTMAVPPGALPAAAASPALRDLFERALLGSPSERPEATRWIEALEEFRASLQMCVATGAHARPTGLSRCCLCEVEALTGVRLFPVDHRGADPVEHVLSRWRDLGARCMTLCLPEPADLIDRTRLWPVRRRVCVIARCWGAMRTGRGQQALGLGLALVAVWLGVRMALLSAGLLVVGELLLRLRLFGTLRSPAALLEGARQAFLRARVRLEESRVAAPFRDLEEAPWLVSALEIRGARLGPRGRIPWAPAEVGEERRQIAARLASTLEKLESSERELAALRDVLVGHFEATHREVLRLGQLVALVA